MAVNLMEMAQKMAQAARAGVAIERKRLQTILAERQKKSTLSSR
jgi:ABC-type enterobactin transport system permease subunit